MLLPLARDDPEDQQRRAALQQGLQKLGWTEGHNILVEYRWFAGEPSLAQAMAKELVDLVPDLIVTGSTPGLPTVFLAVSDPVGQGFVASLARTGGNATGFSFFEFPAIGKVLETLQQIAPDVVRIALMTHYKQDAASRHRLPFGC